MPVADALLAGQVVKVGSGQRHKSRQKALGAEEKWLRAHQRHLAEVLYASHNISIAPLSTPRL